LQQWLGERIQVEAVDVTSNGEYIVAAHGRSAHLQGDLVIRFNSSGTILWNWWLEQDYPSDPMTCARSVIVTAGAVLLMTSIVIVSLSLRPPLSVTVAVMTCVPTERDSMGQDREFDVVLWGATGFTGQLVTEYLADTYGVDGELRWQLDGDRLHANPAQCLEGPEIELRTAVFLLERALVVADAQLVEWDSGIPIERKVTRGWILPIRTLNRRKHERTVFHRPAEGPQLVHAPRQGHRAVPAHPSEGRPEPRGPAAGGR